MNTIKDNLEDNRDYWETMKKENNRKTEPPRPVQHHHKSQIGIEGFPGKNICRIFAEMNKNLPNLMKNIHLFIQKVKWTLNRINSETYITIKLFKDKDKIMKTAREKWGISKWIPNKNNSCFLIRNHGSQKKVRGGSWVT